MAAITSLKELRVGDVIKISIRASNHTHEDTRTATVIKALEPNDPKILLALDKPYYGESHSHDAIWENVDTARIAHIFGIPKKQEVSWWIDGTTSVLELLARAPTELPCQLCKRKNFLTDFKCWWCGGPPFNA